MIILAVDLGNIGAVTVDNGKKQIKQPFKFTDLANTEFMLQETKALFGGIDVIIAPKPTRFYTIISKHCRFLGVIELFCIKNLIDYIEITDVVAKKSVFGKGRVPKEEIMEYYKEDNEHIADTMMFIDYVKKVGEIQI